MRVLMVEDTPGDVRVLQEHLLKDRSVAQMFQLVHTDRLALALEFLDKAGFDAVLLDLSLPDSQGLETLIRMHAASPEVPIVVLTSLDDEALGVQLLHAGAQDYLVKGELTASLLRRSLRSAVERKRAEEAIRSSEARLAGIFSLAEDAIITIDASQRVVMFNQGAERTFGYAAEDMIGEPLVRLMPSRFHESHPGDIDNFGKEATPRTRKRLEIVGLRKNGTEFPAEASVLRLEQRGVTTFTVILRDITERKRAERELQRSEVFLESIVENIPHMIFVKDAKQLTFLRFNRAGEELLGCTRQELMGKSDYDLFPRDEADFFTSADREVLRNCKVLDIPEEPILTKGKGLRSLHTKKIPILDENDQPLYLLGISEDITERQRAENQLQRSFEHLRTLSQRLDVVREEERTRIARELHDELGVRMTCMKMDLARLLSMMRESLFPREKMEEKIRSMSSEADSTIAEVQRLASELRPGVLDDLGLVAAIEWQCQDFERRSGIRCLCEASFDQIKMDPSHATAAFRICQEALTNVARHAKATFVRVLVKESDSDVLIEIQDNGQGIADEKLNYAGSLGLLGMQERSMAIGGRLEIAGWPGKGTTVTLRLPCQDG